jgi:hypothetical protein
MKRLDKRRLMSSSSLSREMGSKMEDPGNYKPVRQGERRMEILPYPLGEFSQQIRKTGVTVLQLSMAKKLQEAWNRCQQVLLALQA